MRIAAIGDVHYRANEHGKLREAFLDAASQADVLVLCGDLTHHGLVDEVAPLVADLVGLRIPTVAVLGNHDVFAGHEGAIAAALTAAGVHVLQGSSVAIDGVGFAGVKGYVGGFDRRMVGMGEATLTAVAREARAEVMALGLALTELSTPRRVAVLHYAPIAATCVGEPPELMLVLGDGELAAALDANGATLCVHGHVHHGSPQGTTPGGVPVYNVARPMMLRRGTTAGGPRILEIP